MHWLVLAALVFSPAYSEAKVMQDLSCVYRIDGDCMTLLARNQAGVYQHAKACGGVVEWKAERHRRVDFEQIQDFRKVFGQVHKVHFGEDLLWEKPIEWWWFAIWKRLRPR